jgi:hypothetical protein
MTNEQKFDERIASIHGLREPGLSLANVQSGEEPDPVDIRHAEFEAMADCFLGAGYDPEKRKLVENYQIDLHRQQAELYARLQAGELAAEEYLNQSNALIEGTFENCEVVLGPENFRKLFGAERHELTGMIDREIFLADPSDNPGAPSPEKW